MFERLGSIIVLTLLCFISPAHSQDNDVMGILAAAKMTGLCGMLDQLIDFQVKTQFDCGNAFVARVWAMEAARLGMTAQELSDTCNKSTELYNSVWQAAEESEKE